MCHKTSSYFCRGKQRTLLNRFFISRETTLLWKLFNIYFDWKRIGPTKIYFHSVRITGLYINLFIVAHIHTHIYLYSLKKNHLAVLKLFFISLKRNESIIKFTSSCFVFYDLVMYSIYYIYESNLSR